MQPCRCPSHCHRREPAGGPEHRITCSGHKRQIVRSAPWRERNWSPRKRPTLRKRAVAMIVLLVAAFRCRHPSSGHSLAIPTPPGAKPAGTGSHGRVCFRGCTPRVSPVPRRYASFRRAKARTAANPPVEPVSFRLSRFWGKFGASRATIECLNFKFEDTPEGQFVATVIAAQGQLEPLQNRLQALQKMKARLGGRSWPHADPRRTAGLHRPGSPRRLCLGPLLAPSGSETVPGVSSRPQRRSAGGADRDFTR